MAKIKGCVENTPYRGYILSKLEASELLGKRPQPVIKKLSEATALPEAMTCQKNRSLLELKSNLARSQSSSPRGDRGCCVLNSKKKYCEEVAGASVVGLGIVAALDKPNAGSGGGQGEILAKFFVGSLSLNLNLNHNRSDTIPIVAGVYSCSPKPSATSPPRPPQTGARADDAADDDGTSKSSVFCESPPAYGGGTGTQVIPAFPSPDFLSSCHLCWKKLRCRDIYMYRGEKAFCSTECRYRQIVTDERKEKCRAEASRPANISSSSYTNAHNWANSPLPVSSPLRPTPTPLYSRRQPPLKV